MPKDNLALKIAETARQERQQDERPDISSSSDPDL